mgnify:CR=1 FL=1
MFSVVMGVGLLTGPRPERRKRVLSGPVFSRPVNRTGFGEQKQAAVSKSLCLCMASCQFDLPAANRGKRVYNRDEPVIAGDMPDCPAIMSRGVV